MKMRWISTVPRAGPVPAVADVADLTAGELRLVEAIVEPGATLRPELAYRS